MMAMTEATRGRWQVEQGLRKQQRCSHDELQLNPSSKYSCRPPGSPDPCCCQCDAVPLWEKQFCVDECGMPWWKICATKQIAFIYPKVMKWDDSAGEEAFRDAKRRYWAKIDGLPPCDTIPLPDPDMHVDACSVDPELAEGFRKPSAVTDDEASDASSESLYSIRDYAGMQIPVSGRGDEEDDRVPVVALRGGNDDPTPPVTGWGVDAEVYPIPVGGWEDAEYPALPTNDYGCVDHQGPVPVGSWDGSNNDGRMGNPWKQLKSCIHKWRRRRHGEKTNNGCHQSGSPFRYHRLDEQACY